MNQLNAARDAGNRRIHAALQLEQSGDTSRAIAAYYEGIATLQDAINWPLSAADRYFPLSFETLNWRNNWL